LAQTVWKCAKYEHRVVIWEPFKASSCLFLELRVYDGSMEDSTTHLRKRFLHFPIVVSWNCYTIRFRNPSWKLVTIGRISCCLIYILPKTTCSICFLLFLCASRRHLFDLLGNFLSFSAFFSFLCAAVLVKHQWFEFLFHLSFDSCKSDAYVLYWFMSLINFYVGVGFFPKRFNDQLKFLSCITWLSFNV